MGFLDNSGDIILDAVLTDAGRKRLAAGNGSFKITKYAFGDDELNYSLYDKTNVNGSAYYDLTILQTPIEAAHTDSTISLRNKLYTMAAPTSPTGEQGLLYLPELKLNTTSVAQEALTSRNAYVVISEDDAYDAITDPNPGSVKLKLRDGYVDGRTVAGSVASTGFRVAQGMNNAAAGGDTTILQSGLVETQFSIIMDRRYLELVSPNEAGGGTAMTATVRSNVFSGAKNLRVYTVSMFSDSALFASRPTTPAFLGPSAERDLLLHVKASTELQTNEAYYYDNFGSEVAAFDTDFGTMSVITTTIRVVGGSMGASVSIPVEVIAKIT